jgi:recombination associated protein RdgC
MLKNAIIFQVTPGFRLDPEMLQRCPAVPCASNLVRTVGFAEPCAHSTANLVHHVAGYSVICLETEDRLLPGSVVQEEVDLRAEALEKQQGYKPGRKQLKELKERVTEELLPKAFTQKRRTLGVFTGQYFIVDTSSPARADTMIETLLRSLDNLPLALVKTQKHITNQMVEWLIGECPASLTVDNFVELERPESGKPAISYKRTQLEVGDMRRCISYGYLPRKIGITYNERLSLKVDDSLHLKQLAPLDLMNTEKRKRDKEADSMAEAFDADIALMVGEIVQTMDYLIEQLGGLVLPDPDLASGALMQNIHDLAIKQGNTVTIEHKGEVLASFGAQA